MKAVFGGEDDGGIGLRIKDNNGVSHGISVNFEGEITYHEQDGYPDDPDERTEAGNEHVNQARRFARYWVYRKRGYDTLKPVQNPDRIAQAAVVLQLLSVDAVERLFGELYQQFRSASTDSDRPITLPDGVGHQEQCTNRTSISAWTTRHRRHMKQWSKSCKELRIPLLGSKTRQHFWRVLLST